MAARISTGKRQHLLQLVAGMVDEASWAPPVCPGCHAVSPDPCPSWCPDRQIEEEREARREESAACEEEEDW